MDIGLAGRWADGAGCSGQLSVGCAGGRWLELGGDAMTLP